MCLVRVTDGTHLVGTTANRTTYGRCVGIAATAGDVSNPTVIMIETGIVEPSVTGLAVGAESWVRVSATGTLERVTPGGGDDIVGKAHADGSVQLSPGTWDSANYAGGGGGGFTPPTGTGFVSVTAGALDGASIKVNLASATYVTGTLPEGNGGTGFTAFGAGISAWLQTPNSANFFAAQTGTTGTGSVVGNTAPTFRTGILLNNPANTFAYTFTPAAIAAARTITLPLLAGNDTMVCEAFTQTLTNKTIAGASNTLTVRIANDVTGLGANVATALATFSSANIKTACTDETGSGGALVFATSPTLTTPVINGQVQGAAVAVAALAIDWSLGNVFTKTLAAGANTFTFSNQASGMTIMVRVTGAASTLTWPTVKWAAGAAPTQTASGTDVYTFVHDGTSVYGSVVQAMA